MFRRPSIRYGKTPEPETPYQRAAQAWDDRIGSARVQARNWRLAFVGTMALSGGLTAGIVWQSARGYIVPWVVEVDKLGEARAVEPATAGYRPTDPQVAFHLARFIEQVRSIPADPIIVRQNWLRAYDFTTDKGALALNDYARTNDPFASVGKPTRTDLTTNLVINTNRRTYHLELRATQRTWMASVSWTYPADRLIALRGQNAAAQATAPIASGVDVGALQFRYRMIGDNPPWRPLRAFDDGQQVFIEFPAGIGQGEMPPLFVVGPEGGGELVNYRVSGRHIVVDRLFAAAELKMGDGRSEQSVRIERTDGRTRR